MGTAPPPDAPPPEVQDAAIANAGFLPGPPAAELCGFKLPSFLFAFGFHLPSLNFPPPLPIFKFALGINCDLSNPIKIDASLTSGGGRQSNGEANPFE